MRILDPVEQHDEGRLSLFLCVVQYVRKLAVLRLGNVGDDALMVARLAVVAEGHADLVQLRPFNVADDELRFIGKVEYLVQGAVVLVQNEYAVDGAAGLDGLLDGVAAHYDVGELDFGLFLADILGKGFEIIAVLLPAGRTDLLELLRLGAELLVLEALCALAPAVAE